MALLRPADPHYPVVLPPELRPALTHSHIRPVVDVAEPLRHSPLNHSHIPPFVPDGGVIQDFEFAVPYYLPMQCDSRQLPTEPGIAPASRPLAPIPMGLPPLPVGSMSVLPPEYSSDGRRSPSKFPQGGSLTLARSGSTSGSPITPNSAARHRAAQAAAMWRI